MADPVTIGFLAVEALSIAAKAALEGVVGEGVKDAYGKLKAKIAQWAGGDIAALEKTPDAMKRQELIAEEIDKQPTEELAHVKILATVLSDELQKRQQSGPIGVDIGRLQALRVHLREISVTEGVGFRAKEVVTPGDFTLDKLTVGDQSGKLKR